MEDDDTILMEWIGKSTSLYPSQFLDPIFNKALAKNKKIILNFSQLSYVTSSTLTPIIKLLDSVNRGTGQIEIRYDSTVDWQVLTFPSFIMFTECDRIKIAEI